MRPDLSPLSALRLTTRRLERRLPTPAELAGFAHAAEQGVHAPDEMPFTIAWTDGIGTPGFADGFAGYHLGLRDDWSAEAWNLELGVWVDGKPAGFQGVGAKLFSASRRVTTGSWLGLRFQGQGYGTEMRAAVLRLGFSCLGATVAASAYAEANASSRRVSEKLGYVVTGEEICRPRGEDVRHITVEVTAERFAAVLPPSPVRIDGLEPCFGFFGLPDRP
jgi:RimJ/RimL family protein N-acetyltransferase